MKHSIRITFTFAAFTLWMLAGSGCENTEKQTVDGPDVSGSWNGSYVVPGSSVPISASIEQSGSSIAIDTSLTGAGHTLVGRIDGDGQIAVVDLADGQTWTSLGEITPNHIFIRDYLPPFGSGAEQEIILDR